MKAGTPRVASVSGTSRPQIEGRVVGGKFASRFFARRCVVLVADIVNDFQSGSLEHGDL